MTTACSKAPAEAAGAVFFGGAILTMEASTPQYAEAITLKDGKIMAVGTKADALALRGRSTRLVDLQGRTRLPGFIDAHGHAFHVGFQKLSANLLPPPEGNGKDVTSLVARLQDWQGKNAVAPQKAGWMIGFGDDDSQLAEKRHPTANALDQVAIALPVVILHQSGHLAAMNHKGLEVAGVTAGTPDPAGGVIRREADGQTPNGVLEERAFFGPIFKVLGARDPEATAKIALAGVDAYAQFGFTTAQEGRASKAATETWRKLAGESKLKSDVAAYPDIQADTEDMKQVGTSPTDTHHFRVAGVKLSLDGSPQGKTAGLTQPDRNPPPGQPKTYAGYPAIPNAAERAALFSLAFEKTWQMLVHCNGDAASDAMIDAVSKAAAKSGDNDRRTVMIHAQTVREDQLGRMKELGIVPSFFSMHTFYWGDWHRDETRGRERAYRSSPTASALKRGMQFTAHHDAPVALPSALMMVHTTVNRTSRSGDESGPEQRVSPSVALTSITDWAAWQYFEEGSQGTLTKGKLADFVILDKDPTKVESRTLKDIRVIETIKEGKTVYKAQ